MPNLRIGSKEDFAQNGQQYDLIFDAVGNRSVSDLKRALSPDGVCAVAVFISLSRLFQVMFLGGKKIGLMEAAKGNKKIWFFSGSFLKLASSSP